MRNSNEKELSKIIFNFLIVEQIYLKQRKNSNESNIIHEISNYNFNRLIKILEIAIFTQFENNFQNIIENEIEKDFHKNNEKLQQL